MLLRSYQIIRFVVIIMDLAAGLLILFTPLLPEYARYFGLVMIGKAFSIFYRTFRPKRKMYQGWGNYLR